MKSIIKKISVIALCLSMIASSSIVWADNTNIVDLITDDTISPKPDSENNSSNLNNEVISSEQNQISDSTTDNNFQVVTEKPTQPKNVTFSDIDTHWAKDKILTGVKLGFAGGYPDGTFRPDKTVTRAEFSKLLNNALSITKTIEINLTDVNESDWYYTEVQKSIASGFFSGYSYGSFKPNSPITRQEAAKVIGSAITFGNVDGDGAINMTDYSTIQPWAKESVNLAANKGYIKGYPTGMYEPNKSLTRAEAVKIICEILYNENIEHGFNITNYDELYYGTIVIGDLKVLDSVGSGNAYINTVTVLGDIIISAESANSVVLTNVKAKNIIVQSNSSQIAIKCNDNIYIDNITLPKSASIEKAGSNINIKNTSSK